ncbi:hypothetical protein [Flavobacterium sp.]|uniref:hypothetical protein n=1 Tax=Flavobacterium sp. TaxID=239 RepID=UPI002B4B796D|nr:hypothetical protein [Flavobacterium sp.]HLF51881.1 hypothetical protein [Flavobacterium sp.]
MKQSIYKRSKRTWTSEQEAFFDVCEKQNLNPDAIAAEHTEKHFVWKTIITDETPIATVLQNTPCEFAKEDFTKQEATQNAMKDLDTFEGNLKASHSETHYVFAKVR